MSSQSSAMKHIETHAKKEKPSLNHRPVLPLQHLHSISSRCPSHKELLCELNHTHGHYKAALTMKVFVHVLDVLVH